MPLTEMSLVILLGGAVGENVGESAWDAKSDGAARKPVADEVAEFGQCSYNVVAKYLGVVLGLEGAVLSWRAVQAKYKARVFYIDSLAVPFVLRVVMRQYYAFSVCQYAAQFYEMPAFMRRTLMWGFQKIISL